MRSEDWIGFLVIDKPAGMTSHDVVDRIRRRFGIRRVGHLGTLDPMATGVLPLTLGKATRLARFVPDSGKEYTGRIRLGRNTTTCDAEGEFLGEEHPVEVKPERIAGAMREFLGVIRQVPPAYSAKKISGVPAHRLARRGGVVDMRPAEVRIDAFDLVAWTPPELEFRVACSPGTYIRSLARDLGATLGTGGHLAALRRTRSGPFPIGDAVALEDAQGTDVRAPGSVLAALAGIEVDLAGEESVRHGRGVPAPDVGEGTDLCIFNKKGELIAVATFVGGWARPQVVLI